MKVSVNARLNKTKVLEDDMLEVMAAGDNLSADERDLEGLTMTVAKILPKASAEYRRAIVFRIGALAHSRPSQRCSQ